MFVYEFKILVFPRIETHLSKGLVFQESTGAATTSKCKMTLSKSFNNNNFQNF